MALTPASMRERILLGVLVFSLAVGAYSLFRLKPLQTDLAVATEQLESSRVSLRETKPMRPGNRETAKLREQVEQLKAEVTKEKSTLEGFKHSFIDLSRNDAVASMRKQITRLADEQGLRLMKIHASSMELTGLVETPTGRNGGAPYELLERQLFDISLRGDFYTLKQFVEQLKSLPHAVVITRLNLEQNDAAVSRAPLLASLTLAF